MVFPELDGVLMERLALLGYYAAHHRSELVRLARVARFVADYHQGALAQAGSEEAKARSRHQLALVRPVNNMQCMNNRRARQPGQDVVLSGSFKLVALPRLPCQGPTLEDLVL